MTASSSSSPPHRQPLPSPPIIDVLHDDEEIEDVIALTGAATPGWLTQLRVPADWQALQLPEGPEQALARMAVAGPTGDGEWEAADTIYASSFTGWPAFYDVYRNVDRLLRELDATHISVRALAVPPYQWTAALRTSGTALIGEREVWIQQSNYVAGSDQPHASHLVVHTIVVNSDSREPLSDSISQLSDDIYNGFVAALTGKQSSS